MLDRTGFPVTTARAATSAGRYDRVWGQETKRVSQKRMLIRVASPGSKSDSWVTQGIPSRRAAITGGTLTKPPLEKRMRGRSLRRMPIDAAIPARTRATSVRFLNEK